MRADSRVREPWSDVEHAAVRALAEAHRLSDAAPQILEGICTALGWQLGALWVLDRRTDRLRCEGLWQQDDPRLAHFAQVSRQRTFPRGEGLPGRVWTSGHPEWSRDVVHDLNFPRAAAAAEADLHGGVAFPIIVRGEFFGSIEFFSHEVREPDEALLEMLGTIGTQIGQFVEWEQLERRIEFQKSLLESQGEAAIDGIIVVGTDDRVLYWNHRFIELWGISEHLLESGRHEPVVAEKVKKVKDPNRFLDMMRQFADDHELTSRQEVELLDGRILDRWTAPLRGPEGSTHGRAWFYRDITATKHVEQRLRENQEWLAFVAEASRVLSSSLDYRASLHALAELVVPHLADWCAIHVIDETGEVRPLAVAHVDPSKVQDVLRVEEHYPVDAEADVGIAGVIHNGTSVLYEDIPDDLLRLAARSDTHLDWMRRLGYRSAMIVPLVCRGRVLGAITFVSAESGRRYTKEDLARAEDLAARAAFPIDNALIYEERARVARTLQESLLPPKLPNIPGTELAARYQSATGPAEVGGDFYDVFSIGPRSWGLFVGDVSGKGVEAAAVTSLARHTLRTAAMATQRPSQILSMLNAALIEQTQPDQFCTVVFAIIEPRFGRVQVTLSSGGHPSPYVVRSKGSIEPLPCIGTLLGVVPEPDLTDVSTELNFGDKIIFYTDGILDVHGEDRKFGPNELEALFADCTKRGVAASADLVERTVLELQGGEARDDVALIVLGVRTSIFRRARSPRLWRSSD